ncbi:Uncharacterised protein [Mycobacteroides abscessus subsp. abscessus]|nr:Uncharacterised protein [Mycobacteroides abscessus subsp. abscessus]
MEYQKQQFGLIMIMMDILTYLSVHGDRVPFIRTMEMGLLQMLLKKQI